MDHLLELTRQAEATHFWFRGFRRFVTPVLREVAAGRTDLRALDCGCGVGQNLALLSPYGSAVGFDLMRGGVAAARAAGRTVVQADVSRIPFRANAFDIATAFDVFQMLPADAAAVEEMARVVKPGGALVLTVAALEVLRGDHAVVWQEQRRYTRRTARALIESAGLRVERLQFLFASLFPLMLAARMAQRLLRPVRGVRAERDIQVPARPVNEALTWLLHREAELARRLPMPIGSSLLVVARKTR